MLTGRLVFDATTPTQMALAHVLHEPTPPSERLGRPISPELERLVMACLAKDPDARPGSALELALELDEMLAGRAAFDEGKVLGRSGVVAMHA
jgi:serine/threonine-protein kinase